MFLIPGSAVQSMLLTTGGFRLNAGYLAAFGENAILMRPTNMASLRVLTTRHKEVGDELSALPCRSVVQNEVQADRAVINANCLMEQ